MKEAMVDPRDDVQVHRYHGFVLNPWDLQCLQMARLASRNKQKTIMQFIAYKVKLKPNTDYT